jgi:uncharacterized Tic20 family protein
MESGLQKGGAAGQEQNWGMLCHLSALIGLLGVPFGNLLGPLVVWLLKRNEFPFVDEQGKESLNFQLSMTIYSVVSAVLILIAIGIFLLIGLVIADLVLVVIASVKISNGKSYRYPFTIRFIK